MGGEFAISTISRIKSKSLKEVDMNGNIEKKQDCIKKDYYILKDNIIIDDYKDYPLCLVSFTKDIKEEQISKALEESYKYIDYAISMIKKHNEFAFSEDEIIEFLISKNLSGFSKQLAKDIDNELFYIKKEAPNIFDSFIYTKRFLNHFKGE